MPTVQPSASDLANRRMLIGLLLSLLAHALVLSIQFGLRGLQAGGGGPITVSLAPVPPSTPLSPQVPALPPLPAPAPAVAAAPAPSPTPGPGLRLFDPVPTAPPRAATAIATPPKRRRVLRRPRAPRTEAKPTPVIVQQDNPDAAFKVPLADAQAEPEPLASQAEAPAAEPALAEPEQGVDEEAAALAREEVQRAADEETRLAQLREQEAERQRLVAEARTREQQESLRRQAAERAQEQRLAEERAAVLREQAQAEGERTRQIDEASARERLLAAEREAEARRRQDEQLRQERERQQGLAEDEARSRVLAEQKVLGEERERATAAREAERLAAEEAARRLAAERERAERQLVEEAARERAQQLARRQEEEERARRQRAEAQALQQAQQAQQAANEAAEKERARQAAQASIPPNLGEGGGPGTVPGNGAGAGGILPRGTLDRGSLGSRARELMRGIDLPGTPPAALRPAQHMADARRRVVDTLERDVPLRLYVDSFRQKIERNAAQIRMQLAGGPGRSDPLVSVALRSDGSVDDVTIVRSSGRADLDEAVRRIVRLNARYAAFPPNVAARFDVIEIRRIWLFAENLRLLEEVR